MKVLFIIENDFFPRDARVVNEANTLIKFNYQCYIIAPKGKKQKFIERYNDKLICYRYIKFEANSILFIPLEYFLALISILLMSIYLCIVKKIKIIHVANPPDLIIPILFPLKLLKIKFLFDMHDLSVETFKAKTNNKIIKDFIIPILSFFEYLSVKMSNLIITTNGSIKDYIIQKYKCYEEKIYIVRNSNKIKYINTSEINKLKNPKCTIGYFGILSDDKAAGLDNFIYFANNLKNKNFDFIFEIIGEGPGQEKLMKLVKKNNLENNFRFLGFLDLDQAFEKIKNFDFGILPWPDIPKNHLHSAMKLMDYMCCGVPVCTLKLKEQIVTTGGIGIHTEDFDEMSKKVIEIYNDENEYENLRSATLTRFNNNLSWEIQEQFLLKAYNSI